MRAYPGILSQTFKKVENIFVIGSRSTSGLVLDKPRSDILTIVAVVVVVAVVSTTLSIEQQEQFHVNFFI